MRTRRKFLIDSAVAIAAVPLLSCHTRVPADTRFGQLQTFNPHEARALDSVLAQLLPSGAGMPGARETRVLDYFDRELRKPDMTALQNAVRYGVHALNHAALRAGADNYAWLPLEKQTNLLHDFQHDTLHMGTQPTSPIFTHLLALALEGYLCDPKYGGNADCKGWLGAGIETRCL